MVDAEQRVDLFLSFHGSERLRHGYTMRFLMREFCTQIRQRAQIEGVTPNIFFDEEGISGHVHSDIFTALLQLRGGGLGLCVLTPRFFDFPWCLTELRALIDLHRQREYGIRLRFFCVDCFPCDILLHPVVREMVSELRTHTIHALRLQDYPDRSAKVLVDRVFNVWDGVDGLSDRWPAILGKTRGLSLAYLQRKFLSDQSTAADSVKENAIISYFNKWVRSAKFSWDWTELDWLDDLFQRYRAELNRRHEENLQEEAEVEVSEDGNLEEASSFPPTNRPRWDTIRTAHDVVERLSEPEKARPACNQGQPNGSSAVQQISQTRERPSTSPNGSNRPTKVPRV